jgi:hypothetical protein
MDRKASVMSVLIEFMWLNQGLMAESCEHGCEYLGAIKGWEFLD